MRVLVSCVGASGHLYPMVPLAQALRERGHNVVFMTGSDMRPEVEAAGFALMDGERELASIISEVLDRYPDNRFRTGTIEDQRQFTYRRLFSEGRVMANVSVALANAETFGPELIINDFCDYIGPLVAAVRDIPNATVGVGLVPELQLLDLAASGVASSWRACGLEPRDDAGIYRSLYLNQVPRSMQRPLPGGVPTFDLYPVSVVTHGGSGSFLGALCYGVPMIVLPLGADQEENADHVTRAGAGIKILREDLDRDLRPAVLRLLEDRTYRDEARRLRDEIALMPQPAAIVPTLEELTR